MGAMDRPCLQTLEDLSPMVLQKLTSPLQGEWTPLHTTQAVLFYSGVRVRVRDWGQCQGSILRTEMRRRGGEGGTGERVDKTPQ